MSYIGKSPIVGNFQVCDAISVVNGQAAYTMQVGSANVSPESANNMIVSLNGVIQKPNSAYTISGATITFASNLASGDVIDFIQLLGDVLDIGTPSDGTVTSGKLASNSVTTAKITDANVTTAKVANSAINNAKTNFVSTSSAAGLQIKGDGTTDGTLQLNCSQNSHGIKFASPAHSSSQSYTLKFPTGNVTANKFLKVASVSGSGTSGVGQLSFADAGGGKINQVVSSGLIDQSYSSNATSYTFVTSHTLAITPSASNSKILMICSFTQRSSGSANTYFTLYRGSTNLAGANGLFISQEGLGDDVEGQATLHFLDSPSSTSAVTYKLYAKSAGSGDSAVVNSRGSDSVITLMEVLA